MDDGDAGQRPARAGFRHQCGAISRLGHVRIMFQGQGRKGRFSLRTMAGETGHRARFASPASAATSALTSKSSAWMWMLVFISSARHRREERDFVIRPIFRIQPGMMLVDRHAHARQVGESIGIIRAQRFSDARSGRRRAQAGGCDRLLSLLPIFCRTQAK